MTRQDQQRPSGRLAGLLPGPAALLLCLAACGGGGGGSGASGNPPAPLPALLAADDQHIVGWSDGKSQVASLDVLANDAVPTGTTITVVRGPAHGKAVVAGGKVEYTPDDGYFGEDSFDYRLDVGTRSSSAVTRLVVEASLTLSGEVKADAAANYTVSAEVGSRPPVKVQSAGGLYSLKISSSKPADMVSLAAAGTGSQAHVVLKSLVGDFGTLAQSRGTPLDVQHRSALRIDLFSTARHALLKRKGALPGSSSSLALAQQRLSDFDVLSLIGGLRNAISDPGLLPPGTASIAEAAERPQQLAKAVQAAQSADQSLPFEQRRQWSFEPSLGALPAAAPTLGPQGGQIAFVDPSWPTNRQTDTDWGQLPNVSMVLDFRPDGTVFKNGGSQLIGRWTSQGAGIRVQLEPNQAFGGILRTGGWETRWLQSYQFDELPRAGDSGQPMFKLTVRSNLIFCSIMQHTCNSGRLETKQAVVAGYALGRGGPGFSPTDFAGSTRWAGLQMMRSSTDTMGLYCDGAGLSIDGCASTPGLKGSIADGKWTLSGSGFSIRYTKLQNDGDGLETWLGEFEQGGKLVSVTIMSIVRVTPQLAAKTSEQSLSWLFSPASNIHHLMVTHPANAPGGILIDARPAGTGGTLWLWSADGQQLRSTPEYSSVTTTLTLIAKTSDGYLAQDQYGWVRRLQIWNPTAL